MRNAVKMRENDGGMSESLYVVSRRSPAFQFGCPLQTRSRIYVPEVGTRMREMARNGVMWPVTASGRRKVVSDVGRSTGDASDRRRGPAAGALGPGTPTPNTPSVEEFLL